MYSLKTFLSKIREIKESWNLVSFISDWEANDTLSEESIIDVSSIKAEILVDKEKYSITYNWYGDETSLVDLLETIKSKLLSRQVKEFLGEELSTIDNDLLLLKKKYYYLFSQEKLADSYKYVVNITTENKKKKATVIESNPNDSVELDFDRWDRWFNTIEEAQEYANTFNL